MSTVEERIYREGLVAAVKRAVEAAGGSVGEASNALGLPYRKVSRVLNQPELRAWWRKYRDQKKRRNENARHKRYRDRLRSGATSL